jgi:hypothetical protein
MISKIVNDSNQDGTHLVRRYLDTTTEEVPEEFSPGFKHADLSADLFQNDLHMFDQFSLIATFGHCLTQDREILSWMPVCSHRQIKKK